MSEPFSFRLVPAPPPDKAPDYALSRVLGVVPCLRAEATGRQFRCGQCSRMQPPGSLVVWVPDGVRQSDPEWSIVERCREGAFNGSATAWCLSCAPKPMRSARRFPQTSQTEGFGDLGGRTPEAPATQAQTVTAVVAIAAISVAFGLLVLFWPW